MKPAAISILAGVALIAAALWAAAAAGVGRDADAEARFTEYDRNGDRVISEAEAEAVSAGLHTHFGKFDRNEDGVLSFGEFRGQSEYTSATQ